MGIGLGELLVLLVLFGVPLGLGLLVLLVVLILHKRRSATGACPLCKSGIDRAAVVCPSCKRDLPAGWAT